MIKVQDIITTAKYSSLRNLPIRDNDELLLLFFKQALTEVYRRFNLNIKSTVLSTSEFKHFYVLDEPDVNMILAVYKADGEQLFETDVIDATEYSYKLVNFKSFILNNVEDSEVICIYSASPAEVTIDSSVDIPDALQSALLMYLGYIAHMTINVDNMQESDGYRIRFEQLVQSLILEGYKVDIHTASHSIQAKGFI